MWCDCGRKSENVRDGGPCATCKSKARKAARAAQKPRKIHRIRKASKKTAADRALYSVESKEWLKDKNCAVYREQKATEVHHKKGRRGYADDWARARGITLLRDQRYWLPVSHDGHTKITNESAWALENGFSILRSKNGG